MRNMAATCTVLSESGYAASMQMNGMARLMAWQRICNFDCQAELVPQGCSLEQQCTHEQTTIVHSHIQNLQHPGRVIAGLKYKQFIA